MTARSAPESHIAYIFISINFFSQIRELQNSLFLSSISRKKCIRNIPDSEKLHACRFMSHEAPFSALLSRNGSCLPRQDNLGLEVDGMDLAVANLQAYTIVRARDGVHVGASKNTIRCPDDCSFQVSSLKDVPEVELKKKEDSNPCHPQRLLLVWPEMSVCPVLHIQVVLDASPQCQLGL